MNAKCALALALLEGRVLNVNNCFKEIGYTNIGREIPRVIEHPYDLQVSRTPRTGKNRYKQPTTFTDYRLNFTSYNKEGIAKLKADVKKELEKSGPPKTTAEVRLHKQLQLLLR